MYKIFYVLVVGALIYNANSHCVETVIDLQFRLLLHNDDSAISILCQTVVLVGK
jgi:hypothetical protein